MRRLWNSLPVRWQIMMAIAVLSMLAGGIVGAAAIIDARSRAQVEVTASLELAGRLRKESAARLTPDITPEDLFTRLYRQLQHHRHIDLAVTDAEGRTYDASGLKEPLDHQSARAPRWFSALVAPKAMTAEIRVAISGTNMARVTLTGNPDDEIAEVWNDLWRLMAFWTSANAVMMAALYLVLGRIFGNGLRDLQDGDYSARVRTPKAVELASIAQSFNALATVLDASRDENRRLYRDLISVQESERRQIASELHDEFGPCLFGLGANAASIATVCEALSTGHVPKLSTAPSRSNPSSRGSRS
ncbi:MAG: LapD/MoxY N-terminal periplasmic domain-containing protein [Rhodomicrobium sp.]